MKKLIPLTLLCTLIACMPQCMTAAAEPISNTITLRTNAGWPITTQREIASLSKTIKRLIEEHPYSTTISVGINGDDLENIIELMEFAHSVQNAPYAERIRKISSKISTTLSNAKLPQWHKLVTMLYRLDIDILKAPLADGMIKYLASLYDGNKDMIETCILDDLPEPDEFKILLAKHWYLNCGRIIRIYHSHHDERDDYINNPGKIYICLSKFNYGFSIEELAAYKKFVTPYITDHQIWSFTLDLSYLRINDLTGLNLIIRGYCCDIIINHNLITTIPRGVFDNCDCKEISSLLLMYNQLETLSSGILDKLSSLNTLRLTGNRLKSLPQGLFDRCKSLSFLDLEQNQFAAVPECLSRLHAVIWLKQNLIEKLPQVGSSDWMHNLVATCFFRPEEFPSKKE